jgi:hypothetical protein
MATTIVGMVICSSFLIAIWRIKVGDKVSK